MEVLNLFTDGLFHEPSSGLFRDQQLLSELKVIGDQERRFLASMIGENQLADSAVIAGQFHLGFMDFQVPILA